MIFELLLSFFTSFQLVLLIDFIDDDWGFDIFYNGRRFSRLWYFEAEFRFSESGRKVRFASSVLFDHWFIVFLHAFLKWVTERNLSWVIYCILFLLLLLLLHQWGPVFLLQLKFQFAQHRIVLKINKLARATVVKLVDGRLVEKWRVHLFYPTIDWDVVFMAELRTVKTKRGVLWLLVFWRPRAVVEKIICYHLCFKDNKFVYCCIEKDYDASLSQVLFILKTATLFYMIYCF